MIVELLLVALVAATPADKAQKAMKKGKFAEAIPLLQEQLQSGDGDKTETHVALAKCYFYTKKKERAVLEIEVALELTPDYQVDTVSAAPDFITFFNEQAARLRKPKPEPPPRPTNNDPAPAKRDPDPQKRDRETEETRPEPAAAPATLQVVPSEPPPAPAKPITLERAEYQPAPPGVRWLPLGIGQFLNGDPVGGGVFLSLELALVGANVAFTVVNTRARLPNGDFPPGAQWPAFYALQQVTAGAAIVVGIFGLIDALVWSPGRGKARFLATNRAAELVLAF